MSTVSFGQVTTQLLLYRGIGYILALINSVVVARFLGIERFGAYAYAMGVAALFGLLPNGISTVVTRTIASSRGVGSGLLRVALGAQIVTSVVLLVGIPLFAAAFPQQPVPLWYIGYAAAHLAFNTLTWPYIAILVAKTRYDRLATAEILNRIIETTILAISAVIYRSAEAVLVAHILAAGIAIVVARHISIPFLLETPGQPIRLKTLLRQALPFSATATIQSLYMRVDILFLGQMVSAAAVGSYSVAYKPISMLAYFGGTVAGALFPVMVRSPRLSSSATFQQTMRGLGIAGPAVALVFSGLAGPFLTVLYGVEFSAAAPLLILLVWSAAAYWLYLPLGTALQARGKEKSWLISLTVGLVLNVVCNIFAIPRWGAVGAATATLASELALVGIGVVLVKRMLGVSPYLRPICVILSATALGGATLLLLLGALGPYIAVLLALTLYAGILILFRLVTAEDVSLVMGWVQQSVPGWQKEQR